MTRLLPAFIVSLLTVSLFAAAQDDEAEERPADVQAQGYYTADTSDALPPILTREFPPGVVCIVVPEACGEDTEPITGPRSRGSAAPQRMGGGRSPVWPFSGLPRIRWTRRSAAKPVSIWKPARILSARFISRRW